MLQVDKQWLVTMSTYDEQSQHLSLMYYLYQVLDNHSMYHVPLLNVVPKANK